MRSAFVGLAVIIALCLLGYGVWMTAVSVLIAGEHMNQTDCLNTALLLFLMACIVNQKDKPAKLKPTVEVTEGRD